MCGFFDSGSDESYSQQTTRSAPFFTIPGVQEGLEEYVRRARGEAGRGYSEYPDERRAPLNEDQLRALEMIRSSTGAPTADLDRARTLFERGALPSTARMWTDAGVADSYQNPYTRLVLDETMADMGRAKAVDEAALRSRAIRESGWGGTGARTEVARAALVDNYTRDFARTAADLRYKGYDQAARLFGEDEARRLGTESENARRAMGTGGALVDLAGAQQQLGVQDAENLLKVGGIIQGETQADLSEAYGDWLERTNWERSQTDYLGGALGSLPYSAITGNTTNTYGYSRAEAPSPFQAAVGMALSGIGTYGRYFHGNNNLPPTGGGDGAIFRGGHSGRFAG